MNIKQTAVCEFCSHHHLGVGLVGDVDKTDVVILAIVAAARRLVKPLEPMRANQSGMRGTLLDIIAVAVGAVFLIHFLPKSRRKSAARRADMEFADQDWPL